jgi:2',3'-cyclic-nucleotide 2'-phosphodiesterase (5'-nucleotidase family)
MSVQEHEPVRRNLSSHMFQAYIVICLVACVLAALAVAYVWFHRCEECQAQQSRRHLTFVAVNDIYQLDGVDDDEKGGLHRLRTLLRWIRRDAPEAILLHAGDFLAPSLISSEFKGEQMTDVMNMLYRDGKPDRMFVVFGNHEFDHSTCIDKNPPPLNDRVAGSQFTWLNSNLNFSNCPSMKSLASHARVKKDGVILPVNGVRVGLFGIGLTPDKMENRTTDKYPTYEDELHAARKSITSLQQNGAEFIVAVTHLPWTDDENLIQKLGSSGLDLLIGGHDHSNMTLPRGATNPRGFKADSGARTAWRIDVDVPSSGKAEVRSQLIILNNAIAADDEVDRYAKAKTVEAETRTCKKKRESNDPNCLSEVIGSTQTPIDLEESDSRTKETAVGDWLADLLIARTGADVAIVNAGSLGLDAKLAAGTDLKVRHIIEMFRYDDVMAVRSFPTNVVCEALGHGFASPGAGAWPHVSGVQIDIELPQRPGNVVKAHDFTKFPNRTCASSDPVKVASVPYVLCGNDGYPFRPRDNIPAGETCEDVLRRNPLDDSSGQGHSGTKLGLMTEEAIKQARPSGIEPIKKGRVNFIKATPQN